MSKQANKTAIGLFIVSALALATGALIVLGSGKFFKPIETYVAYFEGSVKGLSVGAPVAFRGVRVGSVTELSVEFISQEMTFFIPVVIQVDPSRIRGSGKMTHMSKTEIWQQLTSRGLRAQLQNQSLVTGQLFVNLDFYPETPLKLIGPGIANATVDYKEIPTIPSPLQTIENEIRNIPIQDIADQVVAALDGFQRFVNSPELGKSVKLLNQSLENIEKLSSTINAKTGPLTTEAQAALKGIKQLVTTLEKIATPLEGRLDTTAKSFQTTLTQAEKTLGTVESVIKNGSPLRFEISSTLNEVESAARAFRILAEFLERHPEALLSGKTDGGQ
ncbi:MAG: MlaD family protein [Desulfobacterales bacterium]